MWMTLAACSREAGQRPVIIAGSSSVQPYVEKWTEAFAESSASAHQPTFDVQGGGSSAGVRAVRAGAAQLGMSSRELSPEERQGLRVIPVARDAIAVIVHRNNPLPQLTPAQLAAVFAGTLPSWSELGGRNARITVISREEGSGTRSAFEALAMNGQAITPHALVQDAAGAIRELVAHDIDAIGYISLGLLDERVRAVPIAGVVPTEQAVRAGRYPLVRPFLLLVPNTPGNPAPGIRALLDFILSGPGQSIARAEGLLPPE